MDEGAGPSTNPSNPDAKLDELIKMVKRIDSSSKRKAKADQMADIDHSIDRTLAILSVILGIVAISLGFIALDLDVGVYLFIISTILFGFFVGLLLSDVLKKVNMRRLEKNENAPEIAKMKKV